MNKLSNLLFFIVCLDIHEVLNAHFCIDEKTVTAWPDSVKVLASSWQDAPFAEELRTGELQDVLREKFCIYRLCTLPR